MANRYSWQQSEAHHLNAEMKQKGFLIVTAAADKGLVGIHDRRPLVMTPEAAREWMRQDIGKEASDIAADGSSVSGSFYMASLFSREVGQCRNQSSELINSISI